MKTREKNIGPREDRPDKVVNGSLLSQLATAVSAGERDLAFDIAKTIVGNATRPSIGDDGLLPLCRVAEKLAVSTRTVWRLVAGGDLAAPVRVRGARRWRPEDVDEYLLGITPKRPRARQ